MRIIILNVLLYIALVVIVALIGFGYGSKNAYGKELMFLYVAAAITQFALNYVLYRKTLLVSTQSKILTAFFIALLYVVVPIVM
jgi:tryptophan-rich sensory protein